MKASDLIIITDEVESCKKPDDLVLVNTPKHFAALLRLLLKSPHLERNNSYVIKNIGDSLMIRIGSSREGQELSSLLRQILRVQSRLQKRPGRGSIRIRTFVSMCDKPVAGARVGQKLAEELKESNCKRICDAVKLPPPRLPGHPWFYGDLFGECVNTAFRASDIAKGAQLVVEERVANLLFREANQKTTPGEAKLDGLRLSPRLAFAPIKGLDDLYDVGKKYLWLREVSLAAKENSLVERHQKNKVITEVWAGSVAPALRGKCIKALRKAEDGASFIRLLGNVRSVHSIPLQQDDGDDRLHAEEGRATSEDFRVIAFGAYPELDTYWSLRREFKRSAQRGDVIGEICTRLVWEQSAEKEWMPMVWDFADTKAFLYVKIKAKNPSDDPASDETKKFLQKNPSLLNGRTLRANGLLMGEWDNFAVFVSDKRLTKFTANDEAQLIRALSPFAKAVEVQVCSVPNV